MRVLFLLSIIIVSCICQSPTEANALRALYLALPSVRSSWGDDPTTACLERSLESWPDNPNNCLEGAKRWAGLQCSLDNSSVIGLHLSSSQADQENCQNQMQVCGFIPTQIGLLSNLQTLRICAYQVAGTLPSQIGKLQALSSLDLGQGWLRESLPSEMAQLKELTFLRISPNGRLRGSLPPFGSTNPKLVAIDIENGIFEDSIPTSFSNLSSLRCLSLASHRLIGTVPPLPNTLEYLSLHGNQLTGSLPDISKMPNLSYFKVSRNEFSGTIPPISTPVLTTFDVGQNHLEGTAPSELFNFVTVLVLSNNRLSGTIPPLKFDYPFGLDLSYNQFTGNLSGLSKWTRPLKLDLSHNNFSGILDLPPRLHKLDLSFNNNNIRYLADIPSTVQSLEMTAAVRLPKLHLKNVDLSRLGITLNYIDEVIVDSMPNLVNVVLRNNNIQKVKIQNNTKLEFIDLSNNLLTDLPEFLYEPDAPKQPITGAFLSNNRINTTIFRQEFDHHLKFLDLSRNEIRGEAYFHFFSPLSRIPSVIDCTDPGRMQLFLPDPSLREINLVGNNILGDSQVIELGDWERRNLTYCLPPHGTTWGSRFRSLMIHPQSCPTDQYLSPSDLRCGPCYSDWTTPLFDRDNWINVLSNLVPKEIVQEAGAKTFLTCSHCSSTQVPMGQRKRSRYAYGPPEVCPGPTEDKEPCTYPCPTKSIDAGGPPEARMRNFLTVLQANPPDQSFFHLVVQKWKNVTIGFFTEPVRVEETDVGKIAYVEFPLSGNFPDLDAFQLFEQHVWQLCVNIAPGLLLPRIKQTNMSKLRLEAREYKACPVDQYFSTTYMNCTQCFSEWEPAAYSSNVDQTTRWTLELLHLNISSNVLIDLEFKTYLSCPSCKGTGSRELKRRRDPFATEICTQKLQSTEPCAFPCRKTDVPDQIEKKLPKLIEELEKRNSFERPETFLELLVKGIIGGNFSISIPTKQTISQVNRDFILRTFTCQFNLTNCPDQKTYNRTKEIILEICSGIIPDVIIPDAKPNDFSQIQLQIREFNCSSEEYYDQTKQQCQSCYAPWTLIEDSTKVFHGFDSESPIKLSWLEYSDFKAHTACSSCDAGNRNFTRDKYFIMDDRCWRFDESLKKQELCAYPCSQQEFESSSHQIGHILKQLKKPLLRNTGGTETLLSRLLQYPTFGGGSIHVILPDKVTLPDNDFIQFFVDSTSMNIKVGPKGLNQDRFTKTVKLITHLSNTIGPGVEVTASPITQEIHVKASMINVKNLIILAVVVFVVLFCLIGGVVFWHLSSELRLLPHKIRWPFMNQRKFPWRWSFQGSSSIGAYFTDLIPNSQDWKSVRTLFNNHLDGDRFDIETITAVYNPTLVSGFINRKKVLDERISSAFQTSRIETKINQRNWIRETFLQKFISTEWNKGLESPFIPVVHMTSLTTAKLICQTGFANLSLLDDGWFGKGIYFTSSASYSLLYMKPASPAMILCWLIPGTIYPVVEDPSSSKSLSGTALKGGFDSHYILTNHEGVPPSQRTPHIPTIGRGGIFDEIVVNQEQQIIPAFILTFKTKKLVKLFREYQTDAQRFRTRAEQEKSKKPTPQQTRTPRYNPRNPANAPLSTIASFLSDLGTDDQQQIMVSSSSSSEEEILESDAGTRLLIRPMTTVSSEEEETESSDATRLLRTIITMDDD